MKIKSKVGIIGFILLIITSVVFMPFVCIWALNILFGLDILYTWQTWLSVLILKFYVLLNVKSK